MQKHWVITHCFTGVKMWWSETETSVGKLSEKGRYHRINAPFPDILTQTS